MNINIKTTQLNNAEFASDYAKHRLEKLVPIIGRDSSIQCDVELAMTTAHHKNGQIFRAEVHIVGGGYNIFAASDKDTIMSAIDDASEEALMKIKSSKDKKISMLRAGGRKVKSMLHGVWPWGKSNI